jgi:hypothetical protein
VIAETRLSVRPLILRSRALVNITEGLTGGATTGGNEGIPVPENLQLTAPVFPYLLRFRNTLDLAPGRRRWQLLGISPLL